MFHLEDGKGLRRWLRRWERTMFDVSDFVCVEKKAMIEEIYTGQETFKIKINAFFEVHVIII